MKSHRETNWYVNALCFLILATANLAGCSGSSGPAVQQGRIIDTPVAGIGYSTDTQSGVTGADGSFSYLEGETITFFVGAAELASVAAKSTLNWFELGGMTEIPVGYVQIEAALYDNFDADGDGVYDAPSLSKVGAIAAVLTTLDADRDSSNGIVIAAEVAALLDADTDLDLEYANGPRYSADFRFIMRKLAAQGLLPAREVRNGGLELALLYQRMGLDPDYQVSTRSTRDNNADGTEDWVRLLTYDAATGRVVRDEYDTDADGLIDDVFTQSYSSELYGDLYTTDRGNDGVEGTRDWDLDAFGFVIRYEETQNGSLYQLETRELDPLTGLYMRREVINPVRGIHTIETWTMDENGNRPLATIDFDGDGNPETVVTLSYDAPNSYWTGREDDTNNDGVADKLTTRVLDSFGNVLRLERDDDADGTVDFVQEKSFDQRGNALRDAIDSNNDGVLESLSTWQRNARGNVLSSRREQNGVLTFADEATYNVLGQRLTYVVDRDGDGTFDDRYLTSYNADNQRIESSTDRGADGVIDSIETRTYDANGRLAEIRTDSNADGSIDRVSRRTYNTGGYLVSIESLRNDVLQSASYFSDFVPTSIASLF